MNFFEQQDIARRNTRLLVLLFLVAVLLLIVLTNAAVAAFLFFGQDYNIYSGSREGVEGFLAYFSWTRFGTIALAVTATVAMVVFIKWIQLSTGGKVIAESMGGTRILPQTRNRAERRCLNVVEEMALAANMPVPPVYVMNDERGINAFAAGTTPADAIVAVTRGTIVHLKRHELQGVIAHEFSHILNGDMRLNIRLAAMLKGITFLGDVGHILLRSSTRHRTGRQRGAIYPQRRQHRRCAESHRRLYTRHTGARRPGDRDVTYFLRADRAPLVAGVRHASTPAQSHRAGGSRLGRPVHRAQAATLR
jgi:hypothetical protein